MKLILALALFSRLLLAGPAHATLMDFDIHWSGADFGNNATAVGSITLDDAILPNPSGDFARVPPASLGITAFSITVSGAGSGNGTFDLADYIESVFFTNGGTLDLSRELVGQPTADDPWGTSFFALGGGFNMFAPVGSDAPSAIFFFTIRTVGGVTGDDLRMTSFRPADPVPEPNTALLVGIGLVGLAVQRQRAA